ncbi:hypothetical protein [Kitasatospora terrestris]
MRKMLTAAAMTLEVQPSNTREVWGWRGRTLSRSVATATGGRGWLRLVSAPADKAAGKLWDGPIEAERAMPLAVPRPRLHQQHAWTEDGHGYLAELYEEVTAVVVSGDDPVLRTEPALNEAWWTDLVTALDGIQQVSTSRVAVRQEYLDRAMPQFLGAPVRTMVPVWTTAHGDLHWTNLTGPTLTILDWEGWGIAPAGYDAALLHSYSLLVPATANEIRERLGHILDTPEGRFAELAVITELLQTTTRGDNLDLEGPLRKRLAELLPQP